MILSAQWNSLSAADLDRIHDGALQVLECVGVAVMDTDLRVELGAAGARVEDDRVELMKNYAPDVPAHLMAGIQRYVDERAPSLGLTP